MGEFLDIGAIQAQAKQNALDAQLLQVAKKMEETLDKAIHSIDTLDEDDLESLREKRIEQMKRNHKQKIEWRKIGHGTYDLLMDEKDFFSKAKLSKRMVCHFFRESTQRCHVIDRHMESLCVSHLETRFCKINAERSPFLCEKLKIWMLPTLALVQSGQVIDYIVGFDDMGGSDDFSTDILARVMCHKVDGIINYEGSTYKSGIHSHAENSRPSLRSGAIRHSPSDDDNSDFSE